MIKAIETSYKGYRFRSRTEARWAIWLDAMGIKWDYEYEGYNLGSAGYYLPDFLIQLPWRSHDIAIMGAIKGFGEFFFEVKPYENVEYNDKHAALTKTLDTPLICVHGVPDLHKDKLTGIVTPKYKVLYYDKGEMLVPDSKKSDSVFYFYSGKDENKHCLALCARDADTYQPLNFFVKRRRIVNRPYIEYDIPEVSDTSNILVSAYQKAMSARFEFGERK
jgi:hypothetical protein